MICAWSVKQKQKTQKTLWTYLLWSIFSEDHHKNMPEKKERKKNVYDCPTIMFYCKTSMNEGKIEEENEKCWEEEN